MPSLPGDGTREAARRWLIYLRIADVPRVRTLFTHHPRYADLTPVQYAEGLEWLQRTELVSPSGRPAVNVGEGLSLSGTAVPHVLWNAKDDERNKATGIAGESCLLALLRQAGMASVEHVSAVSDAFGYDIAATTPLDEHLHLEVKATTDPTRLVVHLSRHESDVMSADPRWVMGAVLVGRDGAALIVATVSRSWLRSAVPHDRSQRGRWESARLTVPPEALKPGLIMEDGKSVLAGGSCAMPGVWGMTERAMVSS
ncbi:protein NO VEIN domain-containing protein [Streptomyces rubiginosohelvolus]|uniref:protein NO VEIN domain-containing protein n=1 Tax=Streptomyces rubiginosohelvolus TaxID=67362 RepID=UPI0035E16EBE